MLIKAKDRLKHILIETEYLATVSNKIKNIEDLLKNEDLKRSCRASIETLGEAAKSLPESVRSLSPNTQWSEIAKMRDRLIHHYFDVDYKIMWEVVKKEAPKLQQEATRILYQLNREEYLEYRNKVKPQNTDTYGYFAIIRQQEQTDLAIAKTIIAKYSPKFRKVAIGEIKDIIGTGERASGLATNKEQMTPNEYLERIVSEALPRETKEKTDILEL